jgi:hypothetical protein
VTSRESAGFFTNIERLGKVEIDGDLILKGCNGGSSVGGAGGNASAVVVGQSPLFLSYAGFLTQSPSAVCVWGDVKQEANK